MTRLAERARHEDGFTLVELLMAIVIMGVVLGPLAAGLLIGLRTSDETANRLAGSNDAQLLSIWLPPDVQSAGGSAGDVVGSLTGNTDCSGRANALRLGWRETLGGTTTSFVTAYAISQDSAGDWRLVRYFCTNGGPPTTHIVARNLAGSSAVTSTITGTKVSLTVTEKSTPVNPTSYTFTVSGHRRTL